MAVVGDEVAVLQVEPGHDGHGGGEGGGARGRVPPDEGGEPGELGGVVGPRQGEGEAAEVQDLWEGTVSMKATMFDVYHLTTG